MTSRRLVLVVALVLAQDASASWATDRQEDALPPRAVQGATELMERAFENYFRYSYVARMDLTIRPVHGQPLHRVMDMAHWRQDENSRWRIAFMAPAHLRGTQLLAISQAVRDDDHFLYTPEFNRVRRVSGAQQAERVAGTDFSFEDLDIKHVEQFDLVREADAESAGRPCSWVRGIPRSESEYEVLRWCVDVDRFVILEVQGFGAGNQLIKTLHVDPDSVEQTGERYLARRWTMTDERTRSRTHIEILEVHIEPDFSNDVFSARALERSYKLPFLSVYGSESAR